MYVRFTVIGMMLLLASASALLSDVNNGTDPNGLPETIAPEDFKVFEIAPREETEPSQGPQKPESNENETSQGWMPTKIVTPNPVDDDEVRDQAPVSPNEVADKADIDNTLDVLRGMFGELETEISKLQDSITLDLGNNDSGQRNTQAALETPVDAKWYAQPAVWVAAAVAGTGAFAFFWVSGSSAAASGVRKPAFSPLFTRFEGQKVLEHPRRAELYAAVSQKPGIRLQDLCEETRLSRTAVTHHLRLLEQQHVVVSKRIGRSRHFYENGGRYAANQKEAYALLQNDRSRGIMELIRAEPGIIQKGICESLELQASIAHWHIKRLAEAGLVDPIKQGRTVQYYANSMA